MTTKIYDVKQRSPEWHEVRLGKMTGSKLKNIIDVRTMKLKSRPVLMTAACKILAEQMTGFSVESDYLSPAMEWGIENEQDVRAMYGNPPEIGFATNDLFRYFGISPDIVTDSWAAEIKCPNSDTHIRYLIDDIVPADHLIQCLSYFIVFEYVDVLAFISYDPRNGQKNIFEKWIERDDYPLNKIVDSIREFEDLIDELKAKI